MVSLRSIAFLFLGIASLYGAGVFFGWSWPWAGFLWFDIVLHFFGGALGGLIFLYANRRWQIMNGREGISGFIFTLAALLAAVALIGVLWEFVEYAFYIVMQYALNEKAPTMRVQASWYADTLGDLLSDLLGGLVVFLLLHRKKKQLTAADDKKEPRIGVVSHT
ncbi:hypothetical protein HY504_01540 [Candidatus Wolfebacteria bacterium]|nr:hypothetical protein [Candidatus Wolfebacteria bacterium]